jgi:hypothetical protein
MMVVLALQLPAQFATGELRRVHVDVSDPGAHRRRKLGELAGRNTLRRIPPDPSARLLGAAAIIRRPA